MAWLQLIHNAFLEVFNKDGSKFVKYQLEEESSGVDQLQSQVVFVSAVVQNVGGRTTVIPLVVKFEPSSSEVRKLLHTNLQFFNEVLMYKDVLPFLNRCDIVDELFAKYYYGVGTGEDIEDSESIVVLQDLRPLGYRLTKERAHIDYEHLLAGMSKLGRFHALSYAAKKDFPDRFFDLATRLKECSWVEESAFNDVIIACMRRAVDPLVQQGKQVQTLQGLLDRAKDGDSLNKFMQHLTAPEEPLAVVCHGDFCRNNMFFKYDLEDKPVDVKFFDIATARYSSPAVDIAFFLLLNGSRDLRRAHWDDLLTTYHETLSSAVPGLDFPSLEDVSEEVRLKAVYGFIHCSFFLPMMMFERPPKNLDLLSTSTMEEVADLHVSWGGEAGTKILSEMVEDLIDLGCLVTTNKYVFPIS